MRAPSQIYKWAPHNEYDDTKQKYSSVSSGNSHNLICSILLWQIHHRNVLCATGLLNHLWKNSDNQHEEVSPWALHSKEIDLSSHTSVLCCIFQNKCRECCIILQHCHLTCLSERHLATKVFLSCSIWPLTHRWIIKSKNAPTVSYLYYIAGLLLQMYEHTYALPLSLEGRKGAGVNLCWYWVRGRVHYSQGIYQHVDGILML